MTDAPVVVGTPTNAYVSGTATVSVNTPAVTLLAGDLIVVAYRNQQGSLSAPAGDDIPPAGMTRIGADINYSMVSSVRVHGLYVHRVGADPGTTPSSWTFTNVGQAGSRLILIAFVVRGVDWQNPVAGYNSDYAGLGITGGRSIAAYTRQGGNADPGLILVHAGDEASGGGPLSPTPTAGLTLVAGRLSNPDEAVSRSYSVVYSLPSSSASIAAAQVTWQKASGSSISSVVLRGGPQTSGVVPPPVGLTVYDGKVATKAFYVKANSTLATPSDIRYIPQGFKTVADALAVPGFTCGHRGNSTRYAELSMRAMTQTVARGWGMLELSLARTSDGVFFGLHDQTINRTSGLGATPALDPKTMTWAQVQAYQITVGSEASPQPYCSIADIITAYGATHSFMVDPKYVYGSYSQEFWALCNAIGKAKVMVKYSGGGSSIGFEAAERGYASWGFFYQSDYLANTIASKQGPWSTLGMEYSAPQETWDFMLSFGKPVIGHIAPSQAAYDMAMAKGASGVQCSASHLIKPVSWWS